MAPQPARLMLLGVTLTLWCSTTLANCYTDCSLACPSITPLGHSICLERCVSECVSRSASQGPRFFGAIAVTTEGPDAPQASIARLGPNARDAEQGAMAHCRANTRQPDACWLASSYSDSCGAVASGIKGGRGQLYSFGKSGGNTGKRTADAAESAALESCKEEGSTSCKVVASSCAHERTAEEKAQAVQRDMEVLAAIGKGLEKVLRGTDPVGGPPVAGRERFYAACQRTVSNAHTGPSLLTTGDVHDACACMADLYSQADISRSTCMQRAFVPYEGGEIFHLDYLEGCIGPRKENRRLYELHSDAAIKLQQCTPYVGNDVFWGRWMRKNPKPPVPITEGPARYPAPVISAR